MQPFRGLLEALERRAALLDLMRATLDSKRPFVRVGSELDDPALAGASLVGAPYGLSHRNLGTVSLLGPTADGLRQGDRRGPGRARPSCLASSRSSTRIRHVRAPVARPKAAVP